MIAMRDAMARLASEIRRGCFRPGTVFPMTGCRRRARWSGQRVATLARLADAKGKDADGGRGCCHNGECHHAARAAIGLFRRPLEGAGRLATVPGRRALPISVGAGISSNGYRSRNRNSRFAAALSISSRLVATPVRLDFFGDELETIRAFRRRDAAWGRAHPWTGLFCGRLPNSSSMPMRRDVPHRLSCRLRCHGEPRCALRVRFGGTDASWRRALAAAVS